MKNGRKVHFLHCFLCPLTFFLSLYFLFRCACDIMATFFILKRLLRAEDGEINKETIHACLGNCEVLTEIFHHLMFCFRTTDNPSRKVCSSQLSSSPLFHVIYVSNIFILTGLGNDRKLEFNKLLKGFSRKFKRGEFKTSQMLALKFYTLYFDS